MHPENARIIAGQRQAELAGSRQRSRLRGRLRGQRHPAAPPRPGRHPATPAASAASGPGVFLAGPDAFGFRTFLTPAEARKLAADWADLLAQFTDRVDDPARRPDGAVPFELVVLGRDMPELVGVDD
jgi:hypothetical protein